MNTLRMEFATLRERNGRLQPRRNAELHEPTALPAETPAGAQAAALPRRPRPGPHRGPGGPCWPEDAAPRGGQSPRPGPLHLRGGQGLRRRRWRGVAARRGLPRRPASSRTPARPRPRGGAHARSVFSMMNLTFSSVSSVMRTVGWLAYGMAAPLRSRRPPPTGRRRPEDPPGPSPPRSPLPALRRRCAPKKSPCQAGLRLYWCREKVGRGPARRRSSAVGSFLTGAGSAPPGS